MREADVAIRMHPPKQPDLVQRHLMTIEWHLYASPEYLKKHGMPQRPEDLDAHKLVLFGDYRPPVPDINWLAEVGRRPGNPRRALAGGEQRPGGGAGDPLRARHRRGVGFPDAEVQDLVRVLPDLKSPKVDVFFVYPEELRNSKRVAVFRDFLLARLAEMH